MFGKSRRVDDLNAEDFTAFRAELAKGRGPVALANEVRLSRILFKWALDSGMIDRPIRFGPDFKPPPKKILRQARMGSGKRTLSAEELRALIDSAGLPLRAMILLGINTGMGQTDLANLPTSAINLETGWLDYARIKTAIPRTCPLWPITVDVLRQAIGRRPMPKDPADETLVFLTKYGNRFVRTNGNGTAIDSVALEFGKLLTRLEIKRRGLNFYKLRTTFRTVASGAKDVEAVDWIMGHANRTIGQEHYLESIDAKRLQDVVNHIHGWLFPPEKPKPTA